MTSSPNNDLARLRDYVADSYEPTCFQESVRLVEDAFDYRPSNASIRPSSAHRLGSDVVFFGERTLRTLFGDEFLDVLENREWFRAGPWGAEEDSDLHLRFELQQWAVVGRRTINGREYPAWVVLHGDHPEPFELMDRHHGEKLAAAELVRLRAGLMHRRQALLLANHLNRFRNNSRHRERLTWSVVRGPGLVSKARTWMDDVIGCEYRLQHSIGGMQSWGLGYETTSMLALYSAEGTYAPFEAFEYGPPKALPPHRYRVLARDPGRRDGMPDWTQWRFFRRVCCEEAYALACFLNEGNLLNRAGWLVGTEHFWGQEMNGAPPDNLGRAYPADGYAMAFSRMEAVALMRALRRDGYRDIRAVVVGADGDLDVPESQTSFLWKGDLYFRVDMDVSCNGGTLPVARSAYMYFDRYTKWEERPLWEQEAIEAVRKRIEIEAS